MKFILVAAVSIVFFSCSCMAAPIDDGFPYLRNGNKSRTLTQNRDCHHDNPDKYCKEKGGYGAYARNGQQCYDNFYDDCLCKSGYDKKSSGCVKNDQCHHDDPDGWCKGKGGNGAYAKSGQECYNDFYDDCLCRSGYDKTSSGCV